MYREIKAIFAKRKTLLKSILRKTLRNLNVKNRYDYVNIINYSRNSVLIILFFDEKSVAKISTLDEQ